MVTLDALSVVLGFLDEYQGHFYESDGAAIECFYPAESEQAERFRNWLVTLAEERGITASIRSERRESGHIDIFCRELAFLISKSYRIRRESPYFRVNLEGEPDFSKKVYELYISEEDFAASGSVGKLSFLIGAYLRFGRDNAYVFANAEHKVRLTMRLLDDVGCTDVRLSTNSDDEVPRVSTISFTPSPDLAAWLEFAHRNRP